MKQYIAIDLKSFYASVECVERGLDPLDTFLCVADESRSDKTICLAVSPALKSFGIPGRCRLFELKENVNRENNERVKRIRDRTFKGETASQKELFSKFNYKIKPIIAPPQMAKYIEVSTNVYSTYLKYVSPEDIHVYSIDEVFIDATPYLKLYNTNAHDFAMTMIKDVLSETGVTATAGIGTNLYLAKIAMDIVAKHIPADARGVRIAELDEMKFRKELWTHTPLTDFWRIGRGTAERLEKLGLHTMGDIAKTSVASANNFINEETLYKTFGVNAELLIDHAWGVETCEMKDIKSYKPNNNSLSQGQVLPCAYSFDNARIIIREMAETLSLDIVKKRLVTTSIGLYIGFEIEKNKDGEKTQIPSAHGGIRFHAPTSSTTQIVEAALQIFDSIVDKNLFIRRINITAGEVISEYNAKEMIEMQPSLFDDEETVSFVNEKLYQEKALQEAVLKTKSKYGKNSMIKAFNLIDGAMQIQRNNQIGGHKA